MRKHLDGHGDVTQFYHYFNNKLPCPYEHIGCTFQHKSAGKCKARTCTRHLCQFEHENIADEDINTNLIEHMQTVHIDIFIQMAETNQFLVED